MRDALKSIAGDLEEVYSDHNRIEAADVRGLSAAELARERLLCTRLAGLALARTRISSSGAVAGMGVFAARDIEAGEVITCYPGDALVAQGPGDGQEEQAQDVIFGLHVPPDLAVPTDCFGRLVDYGIEVDDSYVVIGIPELELDAAYGGHFVNDGAMLQDTDEDSIHRYLASSEQNQNAETIDLEGLHMVTVATCEIRCGAEIFVSYGAEYWIAHLERQTL